MNEHSFMSRSTIASATSTRRTGDARTPVADKRDAILKAATRVFAQRGFFNAQVADVAKAAGVAAGTVYLYFRSKDDLLVSLFERTMRDAIAEGRAALAGISCPRERLARIARLHLERLGRDRDLAVVFQEAGQASGAFRTDVSATAAAKILFGALDEMATNWMLSRRRYALEGDAETVVDLFLHGVGDRTRPAGGVA
jgi:TetR/AcrR family fatty acid metabolism transcriptional regulator